MSRLRALPLGLALLTLMLPTRSATATDFFVATLKVSLPVQIVVANQTVTRTLKNNDLINLALGRPLGTKIDKKTEVLALAIATDDKIGRGIIYNPSQNGLAQITTTFALPTSQDFESAYLFSGKQGFGFLTGTIGATTLGDPTKNGFLSSTLFAGGGGKTAVRSASVKGIIGGRLNFKLTENGQTNTFAGFIVNGKAQVSGAPLGMFTEAGCFDGVLEPGEECDFVDDSACPGHCEICRCVVCGNNRVDPGEMCDGTAAPICSGQVPPVPCKADCKGCQF